MIFLPLIVPLLLHGSALGPQQPNRPVDPNNGYEDYLRAADVLKASDIGPLLSWSPDNYSRLLEAKKASMNSDPKDEFHFEWSEEDERSLQVAKSLSGATYLQIYRQISDKSSKILDIVRVGNAKRAYDPRTSSNLATLFPELAQFKSIAKVFSSDAYAKYAAGDSRGATSGLLDGLTFSQRISGSSLIGGLVGIACTAICLAGFEENLDRLSDSDCLRISKNMTKMLAEPIPMIEALRGEAKSLINSIDLMLKNPKEYLMLTFDEKPDASTAMFLDYFARLSEDQKTQVRSSLTSKINSFFGHAISTISGDERRWLSLPLSVNAPNEVTNIDEVTDFLLSQMVPVVRQTVLAQAKLRAQMRLLDLHARILDYRWNNLKLPEQLADAVPQALLFDPLSGQSFAYEKKATGYSLFSRGVPETGKIELKYRRDPNANLGQGDAGGVPPP